MRTLLLLLTAALLASCAPSAAPNAVTWDYGASEPGGIQVSGPGGDGDMLGAQTDAEACASLGAEQFPPGFCDSVQGGGSSPGSGSGECRGGSAFEIFPPGFGDGGPWIKRCR